MNHYLNFKGNAESAFQFYRSIFGGEFLFVMRYKDAPPQEGQPTLSEIDQQKIMHISLPINEHTVLMASDINDQFCSQTNTAFLVGTNHYISINLDASEQAEAKRLFDALSVQGKIEIPLNQTFWGALYGAFTDQFGIQCMINCQLNT